MLIYTANLRLHRKRRWVERRPADGFWEGGGGRQIHTGHIPRGIQGEFDIMTCRSVTPPSKPTYRVDRFGFPFCKGFGFPFCRGWTRCLSASLPSL